MSKLLKPTEYANELGISRQAVYAKIKKGILSSRTINGKIYVVINQKLDESIDELEEVSESKENDFNHLIDIKELLTSKEETISVLKESISDLKETNTEINITLRGEIELLKQVFTEMRNLYVKQVDYMSSEKHLELENNYNHSEELIEEVDSHNIYNEEECWITLSEFFERSIIRKKKKQLKIEKRFKKAYLKKDNRVKMEENILYVSCYHFYEDILKKNK